MQYSHQVVVKRWIPILKEYERTKDKIDVVDKKYSEFLNSLKLK